MLFHVVNDRHKHKRSMIFTTNKSTDAWGRVLHDEDLAQAIVDRVLERGRLLMLDGPSIRTMHLGLDDTSAGASNHGVTGSARIPGIPVPEFPEPTPGGRGSISQGHAMAQVKKAVLDLVKKLPADCTLEDVQYQLYVRQKIDRSMLAAASGRVTSHEQVKKRLAKWLAR
jgi:hypothetical protein